MKKRCERCGKKKRNKCKKETLNPARGSGERCKHSESTNRLLLQQSAKHSAIQYFQKSIPLKSTRFAVIVLLWFLPKIKFSKLVAVFFTCKNGVCWCGMHPPSPLYGPATVYHHGGHTLCTVKYLPQHFHHHPHFFVALLSTSTITNVIHMLVPVCYSWLAEVEFNAPLNTV